MKGTLTSLKYITGDVVRVRYCTFYEFRFRHDVMEIMESIPLAHLVLAACGFFFLFFFFFASALREPRMQFAELSFRSIFLNRGTYWTTIRHFLPEGK